MLVFIDEETFETAAAMLREQDQLPELGGHVILGIF